MRRTYLPQARSKLGYIVCAIGIISKRNAYSLSEIRPRYYEMHAYYQWFRIRGREKVFYYIFANAAAAQAYKPAVSVRRRLVPKATGT